MRQDHFVLGEHGPNVLGPLRAHHAIQPCEIPVERLRAMKVQGAHLGLARRREVVPSAFEDQALEPANIRPLGTAAVLQTVYRLLHLLRQARLFATQGFGC